MRLHLLYLLMYGETLSVVWEADRKIEQKERARRERSEKGQTEENGEACANEMLIQM